MGAPGLFLSVFPVLFVVNKRLFNRMEFESQNHEKTAFISMLSCFRDFSFW
jgi:hypothetical protein